MGALISLPFFGSMGAVATSALAGCAFCFTSKAASLAFKSCNCNSSIATRVGFALIFSLNSLLAWLMKTPWAVEQIKKLTLNYISLCETGKCHGTLAIHRICFALSLFHFILSASLINVRSTRTRRAEIQNGWWGPKVLVWLLLLVLSFLIPDGFFVFWGNWVALAGATIFILIGLVLLVDFAHSFTEMCLEKWESSSSNLWQYVLVGSTFGLYAATIALTGIMYAYFAGSGCTLNRFFITFNLILAILITILCVSPAVQEANPKSGLAQASMVAAYCTYLVLSAVGNHTHATCNPLHKSAGATQTTTVIIGGVFTFVAIAYSTTRAATQSKAFSAVGKKNGAIALDGNDSGELGMTSGPAVITTQPAPKNTPRYQALVAAVEAGAIPASALNDRSLYADGDADSDDEVDVAVGEERDDEKVAVRYNYSWFHIIFAMASMYVAMLLTDWHIIKHTTADDPKDGDSTIYIGRSDVAMWMRIISSWISVLLYSWSLLAPVLMPDRFGDWD
ncbi:Membrane protein TMS1 [Serendipita indica DSM 11827]|uniref:Related to TMS1 protein n=1 Tax=Serendipita indica (strain DSM 11827) TaxID=1109443 RepID=G4T5R3_SERID|nr:Membrane protein TMS1 [Serendipita indica DSM 11827]CCA66643.1 related to TMS1 protein [Serendipita indica DSM 11827]